jgi:hypothetical protein
MKHWFDLDEDDERANATFMARVAALPAGPDGAAMPDAMEIWWKAQLLRRWDAQRQAQLPLDLMQPIEIAAGLGAAAVLLYLVVPTLF